MSLQAKQSFPNDRSYVYLYDAISEITAHGGNYDNGYVEASLVLVPDMWFFDGHFQNDPVMPGSLGIHAMYQLLTAFIHWKSDHKNLKLLGVGSIRFSGQLIPHSQTLTYKIHIVELNAHTQTIAVADATIEIDGCEMYRVGKIRVGIPCPRSI